VTHPTSEDPLHKSRLPGTVFLVVKTRVTRSREAET